MAKSKRLTFIDHFEVIDRPQQWRKVVQSDSSSANEQAKNSLFSGPR